MTRGMAFFANLDEACLVKRIACLNVFKDSVRIGEDMFAGLTCFTSTRTNAPSMVLACLSSPRSRRFF